MLDWLLRMFDSAGFPARWHCGEWSSFLGWLHIGSDLVIWFAYMGIPAVLLYFVRRRHDVPFLPVFVLFMLFIAFCGLGHLVEATMFWWPGYRFAGAVKLGTALVSLGTLAALVPFTRRALALPGTADLLAQLRRTSAEHDKSREALQLTQEQLRMATMASGVGLWDWRLAGNVAAWDHNARTVFGLSASEPVGGADFLLGFVHEADRAAVDAALEATIERGSLLDVRFRIVRRSGETAHVVGRGTVIRAENGRIVGLSGAFFDVTQEEMARRLLQSSLAEKETLLSEIHHRVKNNMQIVTSMLSLQANSVDEPRYRSMLDDCGSRVRTMAMIHERLYSSGNFATIDCGAYVCDLARMIVASQVGNRRDIELELAVEQVMFDFHVAIPVGLILNELITNALKHGFPPHRGGRLRVTLAVEGDRTCLLAVADDGVGMPAHFDPQHPRGLGLRMVRALTRQLDGHLGHSTTSGAVFEVRFPRPAARDPSVQPGPGRA